MSTVLGEPHTAPSYPQEHTSGLGEIRTWLRASAARHRARGKRQWASTLEHLAEGVVAPQRYQPEGSASADGWLDAVRETMVWMGIEAGLARDRGYRTRAARIHVVLMQVEGCEFVAHSPVRSDHDLDTALVVEIARIVEDEARVEVDADKAQRLRQFANNVTCSVRDRRGS